MLKHKKTKESFIDCSYYEVCYAKVRIPKKDSRSQRIVFTAKICPYCNISLICTLFLPENWYIEENSNFRMYFVFLIL